MSQSQFWELSFASVVSLISWILVFFLEKFKILSRMNIQDNYSLLSAQEVRIFCFSLWISMNSVGKILGFKFFPLGLCFKNFNQILFQTQVCTEDFSIKLILFLRIFISTIANFWSQDLHGIQFICLLNLPGEIYSSSSIKWPNLLAIFWIIFKKAE